MDLILLGVLLDRRPVVNIPPRTVFRASWTWPTVRPVSETAPVTDRAPLPYFAMPYLLLPNATE